MVPHSQSTVREHLNTWNKHGLWIVGCAPLAAELFSSAFNIWYNLTHIQPLLTPTQLKVFVETIKIYNIVIYPLAIFLWAKAVLSLRQPFWQIIYCHPVSTKALVQARQRLINLPWLGAGLAGIGWLLCIPVFLTALYYAPGKVDPRVFFYIPISTLISTLIALTHGFFVVELVSQRLLYPVLFQNARPTDTPGTFPLSLRNRGLLLAFSAGVCPISSLVLLSLAPHPSASQALGFTVIVGGLGIVFGLISAWMVGQLVVEPVEELQQVARIVATGNLDVRIKSLRADEFGPLIDEFNHMIGELQEKQKLQEIFGRHVGHKAAQQILYRDPNLGGVEQELTVMFADLRNFTARCEAYPPQEAVAVLNLFLTDMVEIVELHYGGMVNKFLGDGFMALFGVGEDQSNHATLAVVAGQKMLASLHDINRRLGKQGHPPLAMGIGIHTGLAVVGSIGSPQRLEYTAIGNTVNVAARIEALTKELGKPLLLSAATRNALPSMISTQQLPAQSVKGQTNPLAIYCLVGEAA